MTIVKYFPDTNIVLVEAEQEVLGPTGEAVFHGEYTKYWRNGIKAAEGILLQGKREGFWTFWFSTGIKEAEAYYRGGEPWGAHVLYHSNGSIASSGDIVDGKREGEWVAWFRNGLPQAEGSYLEGNMHGTWKYWDIEGNLTEVVYANGQEI